MMYDASFYDETYFDGKGKSNYVKYDFNSSPFARHADRIERIMQDPKLAGGRVLDVGCAKGYLVYTLRQRNIEASGIDWSTYAIKNACADARPHLVIASAMQLPFASEEFSLAVTHDVLEHLDESSARSALRECARVSHRQLHQVNTGRWCYDQDESHVLKLPLDRWREMVAELRLDHTTEIREPDEDLDRPVADTVPR
jgi:ubiquinone/menaquinone biosynthesis C-methylase UbiE